MRKYAFNANRFSSTISANRKSGMTTAPATYLMVFLNNRRLTDPATNLRFKAEFPIERPPDEEGNPQFAYSVDILVFPDVAVEVKGYVHEKTRNQRKDKVREEYLAIKGLRVICFTNKQVWDDPKGCVDKILALRDGAKSQ